MVGQIGFCFNDCMNTCIFVCTSNTPNGLSCTKLPQASVGEGNWIIASNGVQPRAVIFIQYWILVLLVDLLERDKSITKNNILQSCFCKQIRLSLDRNRIVGNPQNWLVDKYWNWLVMEEWKHL